MATLANWIAELEARKARLKEAEDSGWRDCIPSARETLSDFEYEFDKMFNKNISKINELAGALDVGEPGPGVGFSFSKSRVNPRPVGGDISGKCGAILVIL